MYTFYYAPGSCSLASHIALEQVGAQYQAMKISFAEGAQKSPEYLAVNPKARVPALVTEQGILTETPAILTFIAQKYPEAKLAPSDDPFLLAQMQAFNSYLCSTVHVAHAHRLRGERWSDDAAAIKTMQAKVPTSMRECYQLINDEMLQGPWVFGDSFSMCDPYLFTISCWLEGDSVDIKDFPKVDAHFQAMQELPAVQRVMKLMQA